MSNFSVEQYDEAFASAMQMSTSYSLPMVFNTVIELRLLEIISENKEITPSDLTTHLPTENKNAADMLDRMLRLLVTHSFLKCRLSGSKDSSGEPELLYELAPVGEFFVQDVHQGRLYSLTSFFLYSHNLKRTDFGYVPQIPETLHINLASSSMYNFMCRYHLKDAILDGGACAFERARGLSFYKFNDVDAKSSKEFDMAMTA